MPHPDVFWAYRFFEVNEWITGPLSIGFILNDLNVSFRAQTYSQCFKWHYLPFPYGEKMFLFTLPRIAFLSFAWI